MMSSYAKVKDWRKNNKYRLFEAFNKKCGICGVEDDPIIYDFHHLDPNEKDFTVTGKIRSWANTVEEASKCVMLCSPCHRKHHAGMVLIPEDVVRFDDSRIDRKQTYDPCPVCHSEKPIAQITCSTSCAGHRKNLKWSKVDLETMVKTMTNQQIADVIGCSSAAVWKRRKKLGI